MMIKPIWYVFSATSRREDNLYYNPEHIVWWKLQDGKPVYVHVPGLSKGFYGSDQEIESLAKHIRKITSDRYDGRPCYKTKLLMTDGVLCKTVISDWMGLFGSKFVLGTPPKSTRNIWFQRRDTASIGGKQVYFDYWKIWFYDKYLNGEVTTVEKNEWSSKSALRDSCLEDDFAPVSLKKAQMALSYVDPATGDCHYREIYIKNRPNEKEWVNVFIRPYTVHRSRCRNHSFQDAYFVRARWDGFYRRDYFGTVNDVYDFNRMRDQIAYLAVSISPQHMR